LNLFSLSNGVNPGTSACRLATCSALRLIPADWLL